MDTKQEPEYTCSNGVSYNYNEIYNDESSDEEKDEYYDSDWIVPDDDCSLDDVGEVQYYTHIISLFILSCMALYF